jgi:hypothetical protein
VLSGGWFRVRVLLFGIWECGSGIGARGLGSRVRDLEFWVLVLAIGVWGLCFKVWSLRFGV